MKMLHFNCKNMQAYCMIHSIDNIALMLFSKLCYLDTTMATASLTTLQLVKGKNVFIDLDFLCRVQ